jgi:two-component system, LytTR family, sensor kinase
MTIDKQRVKIYAWIGLIYLVLHLVFDLFQNTDTFFPRIFNNIWLVLYLVPLNYLMFEHVLPFIKLDWRRILAAPFLMFGMLLFYSFGFYAWRLIGVGFHVYTSLREHTSTLKAVEYHVGYSIASIFFFGILKYTYDFRMLKETAQKLRIEKQEAELNYLKSQTNPHFLFNTLNNIYALSRDKSDLAPESIMRLSKILRFMLYETGGDYIAVEQEVKIMHDYIELEKLRYDTSLRVNFNHDVEDMKQAIPPLLLIPLVENAFKHGVSETRSQPFVDIHLSVKNRVVTFIVKNSADQIESTGVKENIGLSNLRRQLELLYTDYNLSLQHNGNVFIATLKINLASHV